MFIRGQKEGHRGPRKEQSVRHRRNSWANHPRISNSIQKNKMVKMKSTDSATRSPGSTTDNMEGEPDPATALEGLSNILSQPESTILPWLVSSNNNASGQSVETTQRSELLNACQYLFQEIEGLNQIYQTILKGGNDGMDDSKEEDSFTLSGLRELYLGPSVDAETIWGQIELQNVALTSLLKKSTKQLSKSHDDIRLLGMDGTLSDENDQVSDDKSTSSAEGQSQPDSGKEDEEDESEDEETRRIRMRMERAEENMESDDDSTVENNENVVTETHSQDEDETSQEDPAAGELNDGFFDIKEMEDFADEEEAFLPDEAYGSPENKKKKSSEQSKSFHRRQREQDLEDDESEDDMEDEFEEEAVVRRKKYRDKEDIDALYTLYQEPESEDDDDDVVNMTAADFFGKPNKTYYEMHKRKVAAKKPQAKSGEIDDSWGDENDEYMDEDGNVAWSDRRDDQTPGDDDDENEISQGIEYPESPDEDAQNNSRHTKESAKLLKQTKLLENELLAEKPWQMSGESKSSSRPVNSLLEATPEFQYATKMAPTITVEQTASLEEVIKQRVLSEEWDDVVPRELPDVGWYRSRGELPEVSQEKSKLGLGELYEREYLKKAVGYDVDAVEKQTEEEVAKNEMRQLFANLCSKLDALSNYQFAPRPVADEADVRPVTTPAIAMEEVLPLHVSDARGVAAEEIYAPKRGREGILRGETEMDQVIYLLCNCRVDDCLFVSVT